jgi:hypothetical protein
MSCVRQKPGRFTLITSPELRANILEFYSDLSVAIETKKDNVRWQSVLKSLDQLKAATPGAIVADDLASRSVLEPTTKVTGPHQRLVVGGVSDPIGLPNSVSETQQLSQFYDFLVRDRADYSYSAHNP